MLRVRQSHHHAWASSMLYELHTQSVLYTNSPLLLEQLTKKKNQHYIFQFITFDNITTENSDVFFVFGSFDETFKLVVYNITCGSSILDFGLYSEGVLKRRAFLLMSLNIEIPVKCSENRVF